MIFSPVEVQETVDMFMRNKLDVRAITLGISLRDCACSSGKESRRRMYDKIMKYAGNLVTVGKQIESEFGVPIINKRVAVTPISLVAEPSGEKDYVEWAITLDKIAKELNVIGILNIQFIISEGKVYIIEVNPRSSRTVPYISKVTNLPMIDIATNVILGKKLKDLGYGTGLYRKSDYICVKMPVFSFEKIKNADTSLGPEMKSTGEVLGVSKKYENAVLKAFIGSGANVSTTGSILITVRDKDKEEMLPLAKKFKNKGFDIYATKGTSKFLAEHNVESTVIEKLWEGKNSIIDLIESGKIKSEKVIV